MTTNGSHRVLMGNILSTLYSAFNLAAKKDMKSQMCSTFGPIRPRTAEIGAH